MHKYLKCKLFMQKCIIRIFESIRTKKSPDFFWFGGSIWRILLKRDWVMVGLPWWSMCICKNRSLCGPIQYSKCSSPSNFQNWSMHFFTHCFVLNISLTCFWEPHGFCLECSQSCVNLWFACIKAAGIHQSRTDLDSPKPYGFGFTKAVWIHQSCTDSPKP